MRLLSVQAMNVLHKAVLSGAPAWLGIVGGASAQSTAGNLVLSPGALAMRIAAISADGTVIGGTVSGPGSIVAPGGAAPALWTNFGATVSIIPQPGGITQGAVAGLSADGAVAVGSALRPDPIVSGIPVAFHSVRGGAFTILPSGAPGAAARALGVSLDGNIVLGQVGVTAVLWPSPSSQPVFLSAPSTAVATAAARISNDATTVFGTTTPLGGPPAPSGATLWRLGGGGWSATLLPPADAAVPNASFSGTDMSADGHVVVGYGTGGPGQINVALRWTEATGTRILGELEPGAGALATATNADGSVVVGSAARAGLSTVFRWTEQTGMRSLVDLLAAQGVGAGGIRLDGTPVAVTSTRGSDIIVGNDTTSVGGWVVRYTAPTPAPPPPGVVPPPSGITTFAALGASLASVASNAGTALRIAEGTPQRGFLALQQYGRLLSAEHPVSGFVQGQVGGWDPPSERGWSTAGGAGISVRLAPWVVVGVLASAQSLDARRSAGGRAWIDGAGAQAMVLFGDPVLGPRLSGVVGGNSLNARLRRGYQTADGQSASEGTTQGTGLAAGLELGWGFAIAPGFSFGPFARLVAAQGRLGAYAENPSSGPFPATLDPQRVKSVTLAGGVAGEYRLPWGRVSGTLGYAGRASGSGATVSGSFLGLGAFDLRGLPVGERQRVEGSAGVAVPVATWAEVSMNLLGALPMQGGFSAGGVVAFIARL